MVFSNVIWSLCFLEWFYFGLSLRRTRWRSSNRFFLKKKKQQQHKAVKQTNRGAPWHDHITFEKFPLWHVPVERFDPRTSSATCGGQQVRNRGTRNRTLEPPLPHVGGSGLGTGHTEPNPVQPYSWGREEPGRRGRRQRALRTPGFSPWRSKSSTIKGYVRTLRRVHYFTSIYSPLPVFPLVLRSGGVWNYEPQMPFSIFYSSMFHVHIA
jgi:hypothetical protein